MMITILGDLIADFSWRVQRFPITVNSIQRVEYMELGPGGATNVAITAARLKHNVSCLGEVGDDHFGQVVLDGLKSEGVDIEGVKVTPDAETPVAGVIVDEEAKPAYLGYPGSLQIHTLLDEWRKKICKSEAFFTEGWVEHQAQASVNLEALRVARENDVATFFDPGPGNPSIDPTWLEEASAAATVLLATEEEAKALSGLDDPVLSAQELLSRGPELVVIKRGAAGCLLLRGDEVRIAPGYPVIALDTTGAGDCLDAAVISGYLQGLDLEDLGTLANAVGAAKVQKIGTGFNVPTMEEIHSMLERFGKDVQKLLP